MNLIEQLGGYECAAYEYKNTLLADDFPYVIKATGTKFTRPELGDELLEHRRQHNIFEVGDKVVFSNNPCALNHSVWQVISNKDYPVVAPICNFNGRVIVEANMSVLSPYRIQHAEDEEIKAGKRLEVKREN